MAQEHAAPAATEQGPVWLRPWRVLLTGSGAVLLGTILISFDGPVVTPVRLILMLAGLIAGGLAVQRHLAGAGEELDDRVESAGFIAVYSLAGIVGFLGMQDDWFSGRIFFAFFICATIGGSLLMLMPRVWRRLAATVLVLLHFGGIVTASASSGMGGGEPAWLPSELMTYVYRPYLYPMYLVNAYHFYAPDPGASTLAWYRVEYEDGSYRWIKFPDRAATETPLHYQRHMGMAESLNSRSPTPPPEVFEKLWKRRSRVGKQPPRQYAGLIPIREDISYWAQFTPPAEYTQKMLESYARFVCLNYPNPDDPSKRAVRVKVYRVYYKIPSPGELLGGADPYDDNLKRPFFMGEFDADGKLLTPFGLDERGDPFLYWEIPMDALKIHAGDVKPEVMEP
jgi:hypothetical protein